NQVFSSYLDKHPTYGHVWSLVDIRDQLFQGKPIIKALVPAGSILLFDSRICHSVTPSNSNTNYRMVTYVCMMPRANANEQEIIKRREMYSNNRMTGHWCYGPWMKQTDKVPFIRGVTNPVIPPPFTNTSLDKIDQLRQELIGVSKPILTFVNN